LRELKKSNGRKLAEEEIPGIKLLVGEALKGYLNEKEKLEERREMTTFEKENREKFRGWKKRTKNQHALEKNKNFFWKDRGLN